MTKLYIALMATMLACTGCELHRPTNGELDGFWLMTRMDSLGTNPVSTALRDSLRCWSFEANLMQTEQLPATGGTLVYRFEHKGQQLRVSEPHLYNRMEGNKPIGQEEIERLKPFGINKLEEIFDIEQLNHKNMQLKSETVRIYLEKY